MKIFIDTANVKQIQEASELGILDGVTTNPSWMAKEGITDEQAVRDHYKKICELVPDGDISAEVIATDYEGIVEEAESLHSIDSNIVVKIPMTKNGVKAIKYLAGKGVEINCTLVFSAGQALLAAKAGAKYVSPFIGRLDDITHDGIDLIHKIVNIFDNYDFDTEVLSASVRSPLHIVKCAEAGSDVVTCKYDPLMSLFEHPLTDQGLEKFLSDHAQASEAAVKEKQEA